MVEKNIQRFRKVKKIGNSLGITFSKFDIKDLGIKEGDEVDISDIIILSDNLSKIKKEAKK